MHTRSRVGLASFALLLPLSGTALATTWYVDGTGVAPGSGSQSNPYTSIQYAIDRPTTVDGDRILVLPGAYAEDISYHFKRLTVESTNGPAATSIHSATLGEDAPFSPARLVGFRVDFVNLAAAALEHCVLAGPHTPSSLGVFISDEARIEHCTIVGYGTGIREFFFNTHAYSIRNTILWDNAQSIDFNNGNGHTMEWCAGQVFLSAGPDWFAANNVSGNPGLWNVAVNDVHLAPGSICVDAGDPLSPLDPDGTRTDIGALPFDASYGPTPTAYCSGKLNGQGCIPSMSSSGHCSATSASPFWITATQVSSHKFGRLFYGFASASIPFIGGLKCIAPPTTRTALFDSGGDAPCTGVLSFDFNARIQSGIDPALIPGRLVYAQYWYRDPADPAGYGIGLSNGLCFGIAP